MNDRKVWKLHWFPRNKAKTGHGPHSSNCCVLFVLYRSMYCLCVNVYYCHRVTTQLQLTNTYINVCRTSLSEENH